MVAIALVLLVIRQGIVKPKPIDRAANLKATYLDGWQAARSVGLELANPAAHAQIIEFLDIECSACGMYHSEVIEKFVESADPKSYSMLTVHFPLKGHSFARRAANAAECANEQGQFSPFVKQAIHNTMRFAEDPWDEFARAAGVPDIRKFSSCVKRTKPFRRIDDGVALGNKLGLRRTPSLMINGQLLADLPTLNQLSEIVNDINSGKDPFRRDP